MLFYLLNLIILLIRNLLNFLVIMFCEILNLNHLHFVRFVGIESHGENNAIKSLDTSSKMAYNNFNPLSKTKITNSERSSGKHRPLSSGNSIISFGKRKYNTYFIAILIAEYNILYSKFKYY